MNGKKTKTSEGWKRAVAVIVAVLILLGVASVIFRCTRDDPPPQVFPERLDFIEGDIIF